MATYRVSLSFLAALIAISALTVSLFGRLAFGATLSGVANASVFSPPSGWIAGTPVNGSDGSTTIGLWRAPDGTGDSINVMVQSLPPNMTPIEFARLTLQGLQNAIGAKNVVAFKPERICHGTQDGWYIESDVVVAIIPMIAEQTITATQSQSYVATYRRGASQKEDANARRALDSLCAASTAVVTKQQP